jgi:SAM-dependent methyltransferase
VTEVFGPDYSATYDAQYGDKDYEGECDCIEAAFRTFLARPVRSILDLGSGTGNHAIPLARRGYSVVGVDRSEDMLKRAREKTLPPGSTGTLELVLGDVRSVDLHRTFDAVLMMFAVLGYQLRNEDVSAALAAVRRHLAPEGLFVFDVWYGPAVLRQGPSQRLKVCEVPSGQLIKSSRGELVTSRQSCLVSFHLWHISENTLVQEVSENHEMRYFFPLELDLFLRDAGLALERLASFPNLDREADETTWNVLGVARAT